MSFYIYEGKTQTPTYKTLLSDGTLSAQVGVIKPGERVELKDMVKAYQVVSGRETGRYAKRLVSFRLEASAPPPPSPVVESPIEPPRVVGMYRVRGDHEVAKYEYQSRTLGVDWGFLKQTPAVYRFEKTTRLPASDYRVNISPLDAAIRVLNSNEPHKMARLYGSETALFNRTGYPKQQYLVMSHNVLKPLAIEGNFLKFETLKPTSNVAGMTYATHSHFVMRWVLVTSENGVTKYVRDRYGDIFWYLCTNEGYGYIPLDWVALM